MIRRDVYDDGYLTIQWNTNDNEDSSHFLRITTGATKKHKGVFIPIHNYDFTALDNLITILTLAREQLDNPTTAQNQE